MPSREGVVDFTLVRQENKSSGIFGKLISDNGIEFHTIEHAYPAAGGYAPKLPVGSYECLLGSHKLHSGPIETFEVLKVPGHSGILIHPGNTQDASEGCILIGMSRSGDSILESRKAFSRFMLIQNGATKFRLNVI